MANYYLDANALIKSSRILQSHKSEQGVENIQQLLEQPNVRIFYSSLTLLEAWKVIYAEFRKGTLGTGRKQKRKILSRILMQLKADISSEPFTQLDIQISEIIMTQAHKLILNYGERYNVGSMDMLHVALIKSSAIEAITMVSSDKGVKNICERENIDIFDPEKIDSDLAQ